MLAVEIMKMLLSAQKRNFLYIIILNNKRAYRGKARLFKSNTPKMG